MARLAADSGQGLASVSRGLTCAMASFPLASFKESNFNQLDK